MLSRTRWHSRDPGRAAAWTPGAGDARPVRQRLAADARETDRGSPGPVDGPSGSVPLSTRTPRSRRSTTCWHRSGPRPPVTRSSTTIGVLKKPGLRSQESVPQAGPSRWRRSQASYLALAPENACSQDLTGFGVHRTKSCITALLRVHRNDDRRYPVPRDVPRRVRGAPATTMYTPRDAAASSAITPAQQRRVTQPARAPTPRRPAPKRHRRPPCEAGPFSSSSWQ